MNSRQSGRLSRKRARGQSKGSFRWSQLRSIYGACDADDDPCSDEEVAKNEAEQKRTLHLQRFLEISQVPTPLLQPGGGQVASLSAYPLLDLHPKLDIWKNWIAKLLERIYNHASLAR